MNTLLELIYYTIKEYPASKQLSKAKLTKLIYLIDWFYALKTGEQYTNINWYFDNYGPYVKDVINEVENNQNLFQTHNIKNYYGEISTLISIKNKSKDIPINLDETIKNIVQKVVTETKDLDWSSFITYVYASYPVSSSEKYTFLNLAEKAKKYHLLQR